MKIEKTETVKQYTGRCFADLKLREQNEVVRNLLRQIQSGGMQSIKTDEELKYFAKGLENSLRKEGFLEKDGTLTQAGKEAADNGPILKRLKALFSIDYIEFKGVNYLLECKIVGGKTESAKSSNVQNINLQGKFLDTNYNVTSNHKLEVEDFKLENPYLLLEKEQDVSVNAVYDFETKICENSVKNDREVYKFETNDENKFRILSTSFARSILRENLGSGCGNAFSVDEDCSVSLISCNSAQKEIIWKYLKNIFENSSFYYNTQDNYKISDIKVDLADSAKNDVLLGYLQDISERKYISKDEIGFLTDKFPSFFKSCSPILETNKEIFEELISSASKKSLLRLNAIKDLSADSIITDYKIEKNIIDFSTKQISWNDFIDEVFDFSKQIESVTTLSKYVGNNNGICKGLSIISSEMQKRFGIKLSIVTSMPQGKSNQFLHELETTWNVINKSEQEIKTIHDRYWKISFSDKSNMWFKSSSEVDSLRFADYKNANSSTVGKVRELTISFISEDGVSESIKKIFGD